MKRIQNPLIPTDVVKKLVEGSYEYLIHKVEESVQRSAKDLFGKDITTKVLGTFSGHALVISEDGDVLRLKYSEDFDRNIKIISSEKVSLPLYNSDNISSFVEAEADKIITSLAEGRGREASKKLRELLPFINELPNPK